MSVHTPSNVSTTQKMHPYFNKPVLVMLLLGFAAGLPILLVFSSLGLWLREAGIDRATVTMFAWAALGYSFKFIWAPLIDTLPLPILTKQLGRRRAWLLLTQLLIIVALSLMAMTDPTQGQGMLSAMALGAVLLGFSSASQDVVIDAYRIEIAPIDMQPFLSAAYVAGYRIGMIVSGAGALYLADYFGSTSEAYLYGAWQKTYLIMAATMLIGVMTTLCIQEPKTSAAPMHSNSRNQLGVFLTFILSVLAFVLCFRVLGTSLPSFEDNPLMTFLLGCVRFLVSMGAFAAAAYLLVKVGLVQQQVARQTWIAPISNFFERYGKNAALILALIGLYRISDIVAGNISNIFYQDLGFSKTQIADAVKVVGMIATIIGGFAGGVLAQKINIYKALAIGAILACTTNLLFIWLAQTPTVAMLYFAVISDNFAAGLASAVFIGFMSALTSIRFTAVQYALFSSLMTLIPKVLGGYSGAIVDSSSYPFFFGFTFLLGVPVLFLIYWAYHRIKLHTAPSDN